eukprot:TRINITY_DN13676_c0_g1_i1.p1 TRINITY_DN13676_c0_g1~~TRINITY_DN13676_c0_g1_i1.p1  ORF type:complete len:735 (+),score=112.32 TRINITY_DN13676_c0_g1_i1:47-2206(+)
MPVNIPKTVKIANAKLSILNNLLTAGISVFVIWSFFADRKYSATVSNWPSTTLDIDAGTLPTLARPKLCNFNPSARQLADYSVPSFLCASLCNMSEMTSASCFSISNGWQSNSYQDISVHTGYNTQMWKARNNESWDVMSLPWAGNMHLVFEYSYRLAAEVPWVFGLNANIAARGSNINSYTLVLDRSGRPWKRFEPGEKIILSIAELVYIASGTRSKSELFDAIYQALQDFEDDPDSSVRLPHGIYIQGVTLEAQINCFSDKSDMHAATSSRTSVTEHMHVSGTTPACLLSVSIAKNAEVTMTNLRIENEVLDVPMVSVRTTTKIGSSFHRVYDLNAILLSFTSALVLLALPVKLIRVLALLGLGRMSSIYRRVIEQPFDIRQQCSKTVMQLMTFAASFSTLADMDGTEGEGRSISKMRIRECVLAMAENAQHHDALDEAEVASLVDSALRGVVRIGQKGSWFQCSDRKDEEIPTKISYEDFFRAVGDEGMRPENLRTLFSTSERLTIMERLFMPWEIVAARRDAVTVRQSQHKQADPQVAAGGELEGRTAVVERTGFEDLRALSVRVQQLEAQVSDLKRASDFNEAQVSELKRTSDFNEGFGTGLTEVMTEVRARERSAMAELESALQRMTNMELRLLQAQDRVAAAVSALEKRLYEDLLHSELQEAHRQVPEGRLLSRGSAEHAASNTMLRAARTGGALADLSRSGSHGTTLVHSM